MAHLIVIHCYGPSHCEPLLWPVSLRTTALVHLIVNHCAGPSQRRWNPFYKIPRNVTTFIRAVRIQTFLARYRELAKYMTLSAPKKLLPATKRKLHANNNSCCALPNRFELKPGPFKARHIFCPTFSICNYTLHSFKINTHYCFIFSN